MARVGLLSRVNALAADVVDVAVTLREVEEARWVEGPRSLVARLRVRGLGARERSTFERRALFSLVYRLDACMNGESNCYRRSLVHLALDGPSAREPLVLGLDVAQGKPHGHAWVVGSEANATRFDVEFTV